jgi:hypothetical protein
LIALEPPYTLRQNKGGTLENAAILRETPHDGKQRKRKLMGNWGYQPKEMGY